MNSHSHCKVALSPLAKLRETESCRNSTEVIMKKDPDHVGCGYAFVHVHRPLN